ncbi:hypothetical protein [Malaciobacter mytili]|uniref:Uncharacterized protein n=1 Tax=Malaciobacter mytili LMG 24559 TaxID=1032238 RepID=A0AAX2AEQ9_9BACT|nr:hypothetical protein [Malaciobacter mytili]AXH13865.1 hypothetical protein AMYT_0246 [Malaciobacter mytili LMG 24559]RXI37079.1 hypothetical protein CRU99_12575 [Malaciobacter mytili]RXK15482.1 hypothetical protein CP985_08090 [Malaciobacter mytili LMG 24559]
MNIPHLPPVKFAQEIKEVKENLVKVYCEFPFVPTLAMFFEAAAQSSAAFSKSDEKKIGFVISLKNIELIKEATNLTYIMQVKKEYEMGSICEFSFEALDKEEVYAKGIFTIMVKE